ncbi:MAG: ATP-dependent Clp protease proteolytic subunit [Alistipes sp.]|nr:ATP-dependent Clp protease proteolytic subunit [Alistipes sp.]
MAVLKLYNPIMTEEGVEMMRWLGSDGVCFKDIDEFLASIAEDDDTIELRLHCEGGCVTEGWAIVDKLRASGKKITATVEGVCASMATVVLLAASERKAYPHASLLIHEPYIPEYTLADAYRAEDLQKLADSLNAETQKILDFYVERTGADRAELEALMQEDKFVDMERAKELGFISEILPALSARSRTAKAQAKWNNNHQNFNNMAENKTKVAELLTALGEALGLSQPKAVAYSLTTESGDTITIDKPEGEDPAVGDAASPDGEHKMPDGTTIVVVDGVITEIKPAGGNGGNNDDELAQANARIAELEAELATAKAEVESAKAEAESAKAQAKTKEEMEILNLVTIAGGKEWLAQAKSEYKPAKRTASTSAKKSRLQERLEEYNRR